MVQRFVRNNFVHGDSGAYNLFNVSAFSARPFLDSVISFKVNIYIVNMFS